MNNECRKIKDELESCYDLPFYVNFKQEYHDPIYVIRPENEIGELFEVTVTIRQEIRLIIEIVPQKYSADMINDMNNATREKRELFLKYINLWEVENAKVDIQINHHACNLMGNELWDEQWENFRIRISRVLLEIHEDSDEDRRIEKWALLAVGMLMSLLNIEVMGHEDKYLEGKKTQSVSNRYERNPANRELCLAFNGHLCKICGFDFERKYGSLGHSFIHVHHIETVASHSSEYYLDPRTEMIPVCPNCHAMLHKSDLPMQPEELRTIIKRIQEGNIHETI